ncbi:MAG: phosphopantetheine-binding protein, partial [Bauldia sp.]
DAFDTPGSVQAGARPDVRGKSVSTVVLRLFRDIFGEIAEIESDSDFFELGGDSLMAESLMVAIEQALGVILSPAVLLEAPTPVKLAEAVERELGHERPRYLVSVQEEGYRLPLFCVHGMNGASTFPARIAVVAGRDRPVYAFRAVGLQRGEIPRTSVEEIAAGYVAELKCVRPTGPYLIFGQCGPAFVAYEMAQQLLRSGDAVAGLILGDPPVSTGIAWLARDQATLGAIQAKARKTAEAAAQRARDNPDLPGPARTNIVGKSILGAVGAYVPRPFPGETLAVCSSRRAGLLTDPRRGLPSLLPRLTLIRVGRTHDDVFKSNVATTLAAIKAFVDRVSPI